MSKLLIASGGTVETVCLKCVANKARSDGEEVGQRYSFTTPHGEYIWDVEKALRLVNATINDRAARGDFVVFDRQMMEAWLTNLQPDAIDIDYARHVNPRQPGIVTQAWDCKQGIVAAVLIDGTHRMFHALAKGMPFHAYVLSHAESMACLLERPSLPPEVMARLEAMEAFPCATVGG
jgi:hypothetical protein